MIGKRERADYLRNFVFGVEDSLVSTVGLLSGVAIAGVPRSTIFLMGLVLIFVEAFSMGVGSLLSEQSSESYMKQAEAPWRKTMADAGVMFVSYFISGFIPLLPYLVAETKTAFPVSIGLSLLALFLLGIWGARLSHLNAWHQGLKMMLIGGSAIALGVFIGSVIHTSGFTL